jgi:uncharacterized protein YndB with AHSA1/START domain
MERTRFVYVAYIASSPGKVWNALIDPQMTEKYWQHENVSDWKAGSRWEHRRCDTKKTLDMVGKVIQSVPPRRLVLSWAEPDDANNEEKHSRVTIDIAPYRDGVRLTVDHEALEPDSEMLEGITRGWPMVISSLKSLLETGRALPVLWDMPVEETAGRR